MSDQNKNGSDPPQPLDEGLKAAFGLGSVLESLAPRLGERGKVLLREEESGQGSPVIDPRAAEAAGLTQGRGNYQLLGEIARGGMGVVFKGHDRDLGRDVALKVMHDELADDPAILARFVEEAQIGGQLQHPGIVPVYELGLMADDRPFFTMKLVKGRTLTQLLAEREGPGHDQRRFLSIFEDICQTMAYAHSRGVIHRDLKPSNVMVGAFGEVQVVDWGLAKVLRGGSSSTRSEPRTEVSVIETVRSGSDSGTGSDSVAGSVMGTPAFMSPEQASGDIENLDERTDVFALGGILCEILTGKPPYPGPKQYAIAQASEARQEDLSGRLASCEVDVELVRLARECLAPDPAARPRNATGIAKRLSEYMASVEERAQAAIVRAAEERSRRRATLVIAISVVSVVMLIGGGWFWLDLQHDRRVRDTASNVRAALAQADAATLAADWDAATAALGRAQAFIESGEAEEELHAYVQTRAEKVNGMMLEARESRAWEELLEAVMNDFNLARREIYEPNEAYRKAFSRLGIDFDAQDDAQIAQRLRATGVAPSLATGLVDWARKLYFLSGKLPKQEYRPVAARLIELAILVDDDEQRTALRHAMLEQDDDRMRGLTLEMMERDDLSPTSSSLLASLLLDLHEYERSLRVLERALDRDPQDFQLHAQYVWHLNQDAVGEYQLALMHLTAARALKPKSVFVAEQFFDTYWAMGRHDLAMELCRDVAESVPNLEQDPAYQTDYAWMLLTAPDPGLRDPDLALGLAREAVAKEDNAWSRCVLGVALYRAGDLTGAYDSLLRAYRLSDELVDGQKSTEIRPATFYFLAMVQARRGEKDDAHRWYEDGERCVSRCRLRVIDQEQVPRFIAEAVSILGIEEDDR